MASDKEQKFNFKDWSNDEIAQYLFDLTSQKKATHQFVLDELNEKEQKDKIKIIDKLKNQILLSPECFTDKQSTYIERLTNYSIVAYAQFKEIKFEDVLTELDYKNDGPEIEEQKTIELSFFECMRENISKVIVGGGAGLIAGFIIVSILAALTAAAIISIPFSPLIFVGIGTLGLLAGVIISAIKTYKKHRVVEVEPEEKKDDSDSQNKISFFHKEKPLLHNQKADANEDDVDEGVDVVVVDKSVIEAQYHLPTPKTMTTD